MSIQKKVLPIKKELGIYIHIPFCVYKCIYCDFLSMPAEDEVKEKYVTALCEEVDDFAKKTGDSYVVKTIFFGGGTPSILSSELFSRIMGALKHGFVFEDTCEITVECNPGTVSEELFATYQREGVNRISFGLQSVQDEELKLLGRIHTYDEFLYSYELAKKMGFDNINIDIMSALPGQTVESWTKTLETVISLKPAHISAYSLIVEAETPLGRMVDEGVDFHFPEEEEEREIYYQTNRLLEEAGYHRYEISNHSKEGKNCIHNQIYWQGGDYKGFGVGAASLINGLRTTVISEISDYLHNPIENYQEQEVLSLDDRMAEYMFLGLRMMDGISKEEFYARFGRRIEAVYGPILDKYQKQGLLEIVGDNVHLTTLGIDISNVIFVDFI